MIFRSSITLRSRCVTEFSCVIIEATLNENQKYIPQFSKLICISIIIHII